MKKRKGKTILIQRLRLVMIAALFAILSIALVKLNIDDDEMIDVQVPWPPISLVESESTDSVYMSFVIPSRVDDYGGEEQRVHLHRAVTTLASQLRAQYHIHKKASEIILVEWAPLEGYPTLKELFSEDFDFHDDAGKNMIMESDGVLLRIITVPVVETEGEKDSFMEYWAKNVGARRAQGKWIVASNQDNLFGGMLPDMLFRNTFDEGTFYRVGWQMIHDSEIDGNEHNNPDRLAAIVKAKEPSPSDDWEKKAFPLKDPCRVSCTAEGSLIKNSLLLFDPDRSWRRWKKCKDILVVQSGDFLLLTKEAYARVGGHLETEGNLHIDSDMLFRLRSAGYNQAALTGSCGAIYHQWHPRSWEGRVVGIDWKNPRRKQKCMDRQFWWHISTRPNEDEVEKAWRKCRLPEIKQDFGMPNKRFKEETGILIKRS